MNRQQLIQVIGEFGLDTVYKKELAECTKIELEAIYSALLKGEDKHYSFTQVEMYARCGLQYFWRYIRGIKIPPKAILTRNRVLHQVVEVDAKNKINEGKNLSLRDKIELFQSSFAEEEKKDTPIYAEGQNFNSMAVEGRGMIACHHPVAEKTEPIEVEHPYPFDYEGRRFETKVDLITPEGVIDTKFKAKNMSEHEARHGLQLPIYAYATKIKHVGYDVIAGQKNCKYHPHRYVIPEKELEVAMSRVMCYVRGIEAKLFIPCPQGSWMCSQDWCGYFDLCHEEVLT